VSKMNGIFFDEHKAIADLESMIKIARDKMHKIWNERGYTDNEVLNASIEVDILLNRYQQLKDDVIHKPYLSH